MSDASWSGPTFVPAGCKHDCEKAIQTARATQLTLFSQWFANLAALKQVPTTKMERLDRPLRSFFTSQVQRLRVHLFAVLAPTIVNRGSWLWSPANIKGANKGDKTYAERTTTMHNLLFYVHTLCMNYATSTLLLVSSSVRSKQLLCQFVQVQGQKSEQKPTTKNFDEFHNHSPLLTMLQLYGTYFQKVY